MQRNDLRRQRERDPAWIDFCSGRAQMLSLWFVLEESNPIICHMWKEKDLGWSCAYKWLIHWLKFLFFVLPISVFSVFLVLESGRILKTDYTTKIYELRNRSLRICPSNKSVWRTPCWSQMPLEWGECLPHSTVSPFYVRGGWPRVPLGLPRLSTNLGRRGGCL